MKQLSKKHTEKISISLKNYYKNNPCAKERLSKLYSGVGIPRNELTAIRSLETRVGGFWYGNVKNDLNRINSASKYCELWTFDLKERIRAYWGYVSALSGNPETSMFKGTVRSISCHHVYYQPKACCVWDEDEHGYYADINLGTENNPLPERYYIDGDPNKFVTLTAVEHRKTGFNKIQWIKTFEKIIADQGGKCYFTTSDIEKILSN